MNQQTLGQWMNSKYTIDCSYVIEIWLWDFWNPKNIENNVRVCVDKEDGDVYIYIIHTTNPSLSRESTQKLMVPLPIFKSKIFKKWHFAMTRESRDATSLDSKWWSIFPCMSWSTLFQSTHYDNSIVHCWRERLIKPPFGGSMSIPVSVEWNGVVFFVLMEGILRALMSHSNCLHTKIEWHANRPLTVPSWHVFFDDFHSEVVAIQSNLHWRWRSNVVRLTSHFREGKTDPWI